jgi:hypothetical protein
VSHAYNPNYRRGTVQDDHGGGQARQIVHQTHWKYPTQNRAEGVAQEVYHLLSKDMTLNSNAKTTKINKKK